MNPEVWNMEQFDLGPFMANLKRNTRPWCVEEIGIDFGEPRK